MVEPQSRHSIAEQSLPPTDRQTARAKQGAHRTPTPACEATTPAPTPAQPCHPHAWPSEPASCVKLRSTRLWLQEAAISKGYKWSSITTQTHAALTTTAESFPHHRTHPSHLALARARALHLSRTSSPQIPALLLCQNNRSYPLPQAPLPPALCPRFSFSFLSTEPTHAPPAIA